MYSQVDSIYKNQFIPMYNLKSLSSGLFCFYCFDCHKDLKEIKQKFSNLKNNNSLKSALSKEFHVSLNKIDDTEFNKDELEAINEFLDLKRKISLLTNLIQLNTKPHLLAITNNN